MALIKCPECGREVSDKAKSCPGCGNPIVSDSPFSDTPQKTICEECGHEIPAGNDSCPNCGCPVFVEETPQKVDVTAVNLPKMKKHTKMYIFIAVAVVIVLVAAVVVGSHFHQAKLEQEAAEEAARISEEYQGNLENAVYLMINGAADAENACNLIKSVWYNAIYEERDDETDQYTRPDGYFVEDFNEALNNLFSDPVFCLSLSAIEDNQDEVAELMKILKEPPEQFEDAYADLKSFYNAYTDITNLAVNPTGSYTSYSESFRNADSEAVSCYNAMEIYFD